MHTAFSCIVRNFTIKLDLSHLYWCSAAMLERFSGISTNVPLSFWCLVYLAVVGWNKQLSVKSLNGFETLCSITNPDWQHGEFFWTENRNHASFNSLWACFWSRLAVFMPFRLLNWCADYPSVKNFKCFIAAIFWFLPTLVKGFVNNLIGSFCCSVNVPRNFAISWNWNSKMNSNF